jgi:hypothetical protein
MGPIMPIFGIRARRAGATTTASRAQGPALPLPMRSLRAARKAEALVQILKLPGTPPSSRPRSSTPGLSDTLWLVRSARRQCATKINTRNLKVVRSAHGSRQVA